MSNIFEETIDKAQLKEMSHFLKKVNERYCIQQGWMEGPYIGCDMDGNIIEALAEDVEYFHPVITADDRMRYIAEHIVTLPDDKLSKHNKICNTIISHFYGARGIHQTLSNNKDPKESNIDFERLSSDDEDYIKEIRDNAQKAKDSGVPLYGTTELRTSLYTAARNYCRTKYNNPDRPLHPGDIAIWVASFISDGTTSALLNAKDMSESFEILTKHPGIGNYYGYHCSTSNSVNPQLKWTNSDKFCKPGPGACATLSKLFPGLNKKLYGEACTFLSDNQKELFPDIPFHENLDNIEVDGVNVFETKQTWLSTYSKEVLCCQFHVYQHLKANPHLASKRKVARAEDDSVCDGATLENLLW